VSARKATISGGTSQSVGLIQPNEPRDAPAVPPAWDPLELEWWRAEAGRVRVELDALTGAKGKDRGYRMRLRGQLIKLRGMLARAAGAPVPTAKPKPSVADLIARAQADPAGDEPEELRGA